MNKRIYLLLSSPAIMIFSWVVFILTPFLGILRLQILADPNLKIFQITGLSAILYYAPFIISGVVLLAMIFWFREFALGKLKLSHQYAFYFISILSVIFLTVSQYLINREFGFYPNYLYQHLGITIAQLKSMSFVASLQIMISIAFFVYTSTYKSAKSALSKQIGKKNKQSIGDKASLVAAVIGILSMFILSGETFLNWNLLKSESSEGYEGKVGVDYKYMSMISSYTPENITVVHPPQGDKWPAIGNQPVLRYFLYPRTLVSGSLIDNLSFAKELEKLYFVTIDPKGEREWPHINLSNKTIIFNDVNSIKYNKLMVVYENEVSKIYMIDF